MKKKEKDKNITVKTFKYRIYPNKTCEAKINQTLWLCKNLYNLALEQRIFCYRQHKKTLSCFDQIYNLPDLRKEFVEYEEIYSTVLRDVLGRLDRAYQAFFNRIKLGDKPGFPKFRSYKEYNSFTYLQGGFSVIKKNNQESNNKNAKLKLSKIGEVKMILHRPVEGKIKTCSIVKKNDKYYVCFACEIESNNKLNLTGLSVGIDMGLEKFCSTSDGEFFSNPRMYRKAETRLKQLQRSVSRKIKGSHNRKRTVKLLAKKHEQIANQRKYISYNVTKKLLTDYDVIVHEDLKIKNMVKNHNFAKSISDAAWGTFFTMLDSKAKQNPGKIIIKVDPKNTSQICSGCGEIVKKGIEIRIHNCPNCGLEIDRDVNAAINILERGIKQT